MPSLEMIKKKLTPKLIIEFFILIVFALIVGGLLSKLTPLLVIAFISAAGVFVFILERPIWGVFLMALLLPFERIGSYTAAGITLRPSQAIFAITVICWVIKGLVNKKFAFAKNPIFWPILIFLGINIIGLINAPNLSRSVSVLFFTIFTLLIAFIIPNMIKEEGVMKKVVNFILIGFVIVACFGIFQFFGDFIGLPTSITGLRGHYTKDVLGFPRIQSTALEPLYFANYLIIPISILYALFLTKSSKTKSLYLAALLVLGTVNLVLTASRGGYIAFGVSIIVASIFLIKKVFKPKNILIMLIALALIIGLSVRFLNFDDTFEKFQEHALAIFYGPSYTERINTFEQSMTMWREHRLIGYGPGSFSTYVSAHPYLEPGSGWSIVNNETLELLAETGILGLLLIIIIGLILVYRSIKAIRKTKNLYLKALLIGLLAAFLGIVAQYQTFSILYVTHIWFLVGLLIAVQNIILSQEKNA